jgi:hypothetical protein
MILGLKQRASHAVFEHALSKIEELVPRPLYDQLVERTVKEIQDTVGKREAAYGWSGGKDSIALRAVCERAGIYKCVFGMTDHLEYPAFLRWVTDNMPPELTIIKNGWDLRWLAAHPEMLFPASSTIAGKWFKGVQHVAQEKYYAMKNLSILLLGRRRVDGNYVGGWSKCYLNGDLLRYSPIADWTHEEVLASLKYEGYLDNLPPFYTWPRGFRCGTHAWPARQWCPSVTAGWREVFEIDQSIVREAAALIPSAAEFLERI